MPIASVATWLRGGRTALHTLKGNCRTLHAATCATKSIRWSSKSGAGSVGMGHEMRCKTHS